MGYGEIIRKWRENKHISQSELASMLGCSDGYISQIENEKRQPSEDICIGLARVFDPSEKEYQTFIEAIDETRIRREEERRAIKRGAIFRAVNKQEGHFDIDGIIQEMRSDPEIAQVFPKLLAIFQTQKTRNNFLQFIEMYYKETL